MNKINNYNIIKDYHEQTKHHPNKYAKSIGYLDWNSKPIPFRIFEGAPIIHLPLIKKDRKFSYSSLYKDIENSSIISIQSIAIMLELSMGLSAWKKYNDSEWALRMNPSSGNLHPTECYLILPNLSEQKSCIAHYNPYQHCLQEISILRKDNEKYFKEFDGFGIILTSIYWREAWKYGERAFRYCHHDIGHAIGSIRYACNLNGWKARIIPNITEDKMDRFLGFDKFEYIDAEKEYSHCFLWIDRNNNNDNIKKITKWFNSQKDIKHTYPPNQLSSEHVYWNIIDIAHKASQSDGLLHNLKYYNFNINQNQFISKFTAEEIIRKRRSAQNYDRNRSKTDLDSFIHALENTLPQNNCPFDVFTYDTHVNLAIFVHAIDDLESGLYMLVRNPKHFASLKNLTHSSFKWQQIKKDLPLYLLEIGDFRSIAGFISCHQDIASNSAYAIGMIANFDSVLINNPSIYPKLFWETGLIGQILYLEAEAQNLRATGIGCFFDDEMHKILGFNDSQFQSIYHFTIGKHIEDIRLESKPPYFNL